MVDFATAAMQELRRPKRKVQATIPEPYTDLQSLYTSVLALKEIVEVLAGQRGDPLDVAVTWGDMLRLEQINKADIPSDIGTNKIQP